MIDKKKPILRGHFHQAAFFVALGAGSVLTALAKNSGTQQICLIYVISLLTMYGCSSLYHRINWQPSPRKWLRRLDHAAIFFLIAGTGTPISLLGLKGEAGDNLLKIFWIMALAGVAKELFWIKAPKWLSAIFFVLMGWAGAPYLTEMKTNLGGTNIALLITGGSIYTIGALIYASKKPDPMPDFFGYHELFHLLVIIASVLHFAVVFNLALLN
ncbi:MAG: hemolysin III family protein [Bdellovibrionaceae bacterium]|nr:hemolysin III family protein [Pseudobdellovibrionaceae bacterium]NUM60296.1 hemolysin III family protein [Pseudobdellovibrionaceae bacterium]